MRSISDFEASSFRDRLLFLIFFSHIDFFFSRFTHQILDYTGVLPSLINFSTTKKEELVLTGIEVTSQVGLWICSRQSLQGDGEPERPWKVSRTFCLLRALSSPAKTTCGEKIKRPSKEERKFGDGLF